MNQSRIGKENKVALLMRDCALTAEIHELS